MRHRTICSGFAAAALTLAFAAGPASASTATRAPTAKSSVSTSAVRPSYVPVFCVLIYDTYQTERLTLALHMFLRASYVKQFRNVSGRRINLIQKTTNAKRLISHYLNQAAIENAKTPPGQYGPGLEAHAAELEALITSWQAEKAMLATEEETLLSDIADENAAIAKAKTNLVGIKADYASAGCRKYQAL